MSPLLWGVGHIYLPQVDKKDIQLEDWIFWASLSTCTCNVWRNMLSCIWRSIRHNFKCSIDTLNIWGHLCHISSSFWNSHTSLRHTHFQCLFIVYSWPWPTARTRWTTVTTLTMAAMPCPTVAHGRLSLEIPRSTSSTPGREVNRQTK